VAQEHSNSGYPLFALQEKESRWNTAPGKRPQGGPVVLHPPTTHHPHPPPRTHLFVGRPGASCTVMGCHRWGQANGRQAKKVEQHPRG